MEEGEIIITAFGTVAQSESFYLKRVPYLYKMYLKKYNRAVLLFFK